jgi:alkylation response protein AidB-like acyl-CoA dehydrogenase
LSELIEKALAWSRSAVATVATLNSADTLTLRGLLKSAAGLGLLGLQIPRDQGGLGLPFSTKVAVAQALARVDFGTAMAVLNTHNVAEQLIRLKRNEVATRYVLPIISGDLVACTALTEPSAGSDFSAIQTRATRTDGGWQLDGEKTWIINARHADLVVVYAQTQPQGGASGIGAFLVTSNRPGFLRDEHAPLGPLSTIGTGSFKLEGYRCALEEVVSPPGEAFKDILHAINGARTYVAAMCIGMVEECLQIVAEFGNRRQTFGRSLASHQGWRWTLAHASVELQAARHLVAHASACIDANEDAQLPAAHAKVFATRMAQQQIAALMHAMGAEGLDEKYPFVRHLKAAQAATLTDGSTEMLLERIARDTTGSFKP